MTQLRTLGPLSLKIRHGRALTAGLRAQLIQALGGGGDFTQLPSASQVMKSDCPA